MKEEKSFENKRIVRVELVNPQGMCDVGETNDGQEVERQAQAGEVGTITFEDLNTENPYLVEFSPSGVAVYLSLKEILESCKVLETKPIYTVLKTRKGKVSEISGTIDELTKYFSNLLEVGASWSHEKGNKKINQQPKTIGSLIVNLQHAADNSACNGYSGIFFDKKDASTPVADQIDETTDAPK